MNLAELFATWQAWNAHDLIEQAARRAETDGRAADADELRRDLAQDTTTPTAIEALAAQHEIAERLGGWHWNTVTAAREQGATWDDVAAATGTDPTAAQEAYRDRVAAAEHAAAELDIPFRDAERYRAAADDTNDTHPPADTRAETGEEIHTMTTHDHDDQRIEHISGPDSLGDGLVVGEIALPGGLPPDEDEGDVPHWTDAFEIADRDGYVLLDPDTPAGFHALTPAERTELTGAVPARTPSFDDMGRTRDSAVDDRGGDTPGRSDGESGPGQSRPSSWSEVDERIAASYDRGPWTEPGTGRSWDSLGHWARELPAKPAAGTDDRDDIERRLDQARTRLTGYTWRHGVDRDQALAERRERLLRWSDDDTTTDQTDSSNDGQIDWDEPGRLLQCVVDVDDLRWPR
jgi:hypothetical protein